MAQRKSLKRYELTNLVFFLSVIVALGVFVAFVFQYYKNAGHKPASASDDGGIRSEVVLSGSDSCIFYLGTRLSEGTRRYRSPDEIPATDDGLVRGLFDIPGVVEVVVDQTLVILQKSPSARWEAIQAGAREVIRNHLHMHH
jgi:hypothetical protein